MSLLVFETVLLRLYTDELFLKSFVVAKEKKLSSFDLTNREKMAILSISDKELGRFSRQLQDKHVRMARAMFRRFKKPTPVALFSVFRRGPSLFFQLNEKEVEFSISEGIFLILSDIADRQLEISFFNIILSYERILKKNQSISPFNFVKLLLIIRKQKILGRRIIWVR